ncbi:uncharacterized protein LOC108599803 [Drosophila busckii]|uniref:uncharacterized protein LOC108599803 n=1 Tax=Drosophila busckii TaxID=30019 RepID=UPI001432B7ED|nr:uncharacterized protein LOC108599803 [Drosophila busckii]
MKPLLSLQQDEPDESQGSQEEPLESKSDELDPPIELLPPIPTNNWEYKLFPELHNQLPCFPTYSDVFGQRTDVLFQQQQQQQQQQPAQSSEELPTPTPPLSLAASTDSFGMAGLVNNLRATASNVNALQLCTGEDLTTFGLDLASQGDIYVHFNGPFTQQPAVRSTANCALELGMRGMRDAMEKYPIKPPVWDPFVPETRDLGLLGSLAKSPQSSQENSAKEF